MNTTSRPLKLFIGGLPGQITAEQISTALGDPVDVVISIKRRPDTESSLGYAFVSFKDHFDAHRMVNIRYDVCGRKLVLQYCKKDCRASGQTATSAGRLFVRGIPHDACDEELSRYFDALASCKSAYAIRNKRGTHRGYGFVELWSQNEANYLAELKEVEFRGFKLHIEHYRKISSADDQQFKYDLHESNTNIIAKDLTFNGYEYQKLIHQTERWSACAQDYSNSILHQHHNKLKSNIGSIYHTSSGLTQNNKNARNPDFRYPVMHKFSSNTQTPATNRQEILESGITNGHIQQTVNHPFPKQTSKMLSLRPALDMGITSLHHYDSNIRFNVIARQV